MKIKKFVSLVLAATISIASLNVGFAAKNNLSVNKYITVNNGDFNDSLNFRIQPDKEVDMDSKIVLKIENGVFDDMKNYPYSAFGAEGTYDYFRYEYERMLSGSVSKNLAFDNTFYHYVRDYRCTELPYTIKQISETELEVYLFELPKDYVGERYAGTGKLRYNIPLPFTATGYGNVKIIVNSDTNAISSGTYTIAAMTGSDEEYIWEDGSLNTIDDCGSIKKGDFYDKTNFEILPMFGVDIDDKIILKIENGIFDEKDMEENTSGAGLSYYNYDAFKSEWMTYDNLRLEYIRLINDHCSPYMAFMNTLYEPMRNYEITELPYKMKIISETEMEVSLFALPEILAGESFEGIGKPKYIIPVPFTATGGDVKITVDSSNTSISNTSFIIANDSNPEKNPEPSTPDNNGTSSSGTTSKKYKRGGGSTKRSSSSIVSSAKKAEEKNTERTEESTEKTTNDTEKQKDTEKSNKSLNNSPAMAEEVEVKIGDTSIYIDNKAYEIDTPPYIQPESNSALLPLRAVTLALCGGSLENPDNSYMIKWNPQTKTAVINAVGKTIEFTAGSTYMKINNVQKVMDNGVKAEISNGRMFIPLRALGEALDVDVDWNADNKTITLKTN